ncbi:MAG: transcriptional regulator [Kofleriaceae bacterium]|nr:transcriptional regulator [Kofleriaceae bacterium]
MSILAQLEPARRAEVAAVVDLEALIDAQYAEARAAWPGVELSRPDYERALADRIAARSAEAADHVVRTMPGPDLYLAAACAAGDAAAIAAFHAEVMPAVRPALHGLGLSPAAMDELEQVVLVLVLVGDPARPAIVGYGGRGRLRSWVRSIAVRTARRHAGAAAGAASAASADELELDRLVAGVADPEVDLLRGRYREQVGGALGAALTALPDRSRTVLRQYYVDGLTIDRLATLHQVDRATTARWVIAARTAVLDGTRARLRQALGASADEVESILRLVRSQLDLSLRLL